MVISATSFSGVSEMAIVPESECMMPILMVSAACTLKLIPMATTEADKANAFNKVRRCMIFTPERKLCVIVRYGVDAEKAIRIKESKKDARTKNQ